MKNWLLIGLMWTSSAAFAEDLPNSSDLSEAERPLGSKIVRYSDGLRSAIRFPLERVEQVNNRLAIDKELDIEGHVIDITYQLGPRQVYGSYMERLKTTLGSKGAEILFECKSRGCGVSGLWANSLFKVRELYGPNGNQEYFAVKLPGVNTRYLSAYGIERGNRRQYVHLRLVESSITESSFQRAQTLASDRTVALPVVFTGGEVSPESRAAIKEIAMELKTLNPSDLAIVAYHPVAPDGSLTVAIDQAKERAEYVQGLFRDAGFDVPHAYGLGPLVSPGSLSPDRVEIVKFR